MRSIRELHYLCTQNELGDYQLILHDFRTNFNYLFEEFRLPMTLKIHVNYDHYEYFLDILATLWNLQMVNSQTQHTQPLKYPRDSIISMWIGCLEHQFTEKRPWSQLYGTILKKLGLPLNQCSNWGKVPPLLCLLT